MMKRILLVAAALLVMAIAVLIAELQEPPRHSPEPTSPLTDVAGTAPAVGVRPAPPGAPDSPRPGPEAPPARMVPPSLMPDAANPPQWTRPLALPSTPSPPNPFVPPPIAVDPERGRPPMPSEREHPAP